MRWFVRFGIGLMVLGASVAWATSTEKIQVRTAAQDSQPKFIKEGNAISGLCVELFAALEKTDPTLKFPRLEEFASLPRIEKQMEDGDLDLFCGLAKTPARIQKFDFLEPPIYLTHSVLAVRKDDKVKVGSFDDIRKLGENGMVLVVSKTVHAEVIAAQRGIVFDDTAKSVSHAFKLLELGRGRFIFHSDFTLADEIKRDGLQDRVKLLPTQFLTEGRYLALSKQVSPELRKKVTAALENLGKKGELAHIYQHYRPK